MSTGTEPAVIKVGYSMEEAAAALGVGRTTMYDLVRSGEITSVKVRGRRIVPAAAVGRYMDELLGGEAA